MQNNQNTCAGKIFVWGVSVANEVRPIGQASIQKLLNSLGCDSKTIEYYTKITAEVQQIMLNDGLELPQIKAYNCHTAEEMLNNIMLSDVACILIDYIQIASYVINDSNCRSLDDFIVKLKTVLQKKSKTAIITAYIPAVLDNKKLPEWIQNLLPYIDNIYPDVKLLSTVCHANVEA